MEIDLTQIRPDRHHVERVYEASAFGERGQPHFRVKDPVRVSLEIAKDEDRYRVQGRATTALEVECSRCLEPFPAPIDASFDLRYLPQGDARGDDVEIADEDLSTAFYHADRLDLGQLLEEQFYLALPMKPLCREDCAGLCSECGANLNVRACGCTRTWQDPRLLGLRGLLDAGKHRP
jgi:uncharacterized protein